LQLAACSLQLAACSLQLAACSCSIAVMQQCSDAVMQQQCKLKDKGSIAMTRNYELVGKT
jgi:hypothetical protein